VCAAAFSLTLLLDSLCVKHDLDGCLNLQKDDPKQGNCRRCGSGGMA
jgi:hypothetical protein